MKNTLLLSLLILSGSLNAAEVDSFTRRFEHFEDISPIVNSKANAVIENAVKNLSSIEDCSTVKAEKTLYKELRKSFANHTKGKFIIDLLHNEAVFKKITPLKESVYGKWKPLDGYRLGGSGAPDREFPLSPLVKVGERLIGIDKLEHMFGMGMIYFKNYYLKEKKLKRVLKQGIFGEKYILGGQFLATGVFSFGDLSANFNGMRFWNHMLQRRDDVLGVEHNKGPYILCQDKKFVVNKSNPLDFRYYVDASLDESINCPKFARKSAVKKFNKALEERGVTCPMSKADLDEILNKYSVITPGDRKERPLSHWIINDELVEDVSYFNEF